MMSRSEKYDRSGYMLFFLSQKTLLSFLQAIDEVFFLMQYFVLARPKPFEPDFCSTIS